METDERIKLTAEFLNPSLPSPFEANEARSEHGEGDGRSDSTRKGND